MVGQLVLLLCGIFASAYASINCEGDARLTTESKKASRDSMEYEKLMLVQDQTQKLTFTSSSAIDEAKIEWYHNKDKIKVTAEMSHPIYYVLKEQKIELVFGKPRPEHTGKYKLQILGEKDDITASAECELKTDVALLPPISGTIRVVRGDDYNITLTSKYSPAPQAVSWEFYSLKDGTLNPARFHSVSANGIKDSILLATNLQDDDEGFFIATTDSGNKKDRTVFAFRVKDPKAVYWPLIGIIIEVVILLITILIYEKRLRDKRQKQSAEEASNLKATVSPDVAVHTDKDNASIRV